MATILKSSREESMFSKTENLTSIILLETNSFEDFLKGF